MTATRKLAAILAADVAGYSRLMGIDEEGTLECLKAHRRELIDPKITEHRGRVVKTTGDGILIEFLSVVDALRCAIELQQRMSERNARVPVDRRIEFRVGINLGDIIIDGDDIHGDGVNIAARLEALAATGEICISQTVLDHVRGKFAFDVEDGGAQALKNISQPVHIHRVLFGGDRRAAVPRAKAPALALPDKPSIAVLPFQNMSGDPEQEYFADGVVEEIITALSRFRQLFVIARNSSFAYKGKSPDIRQVGRELGVRYVLEGSVRKAANRLRITGQLVDTTTGAHLWAERFDGAPDDIFDLQDRVTANVVGAIAPKLEKAEIERSKRKPTESLDAYDYFLRGMANHYRLSIRDDVGETLCLFNRASKLDPAFASAYAMAAYCYAIRKRSGKITDSANEIAEAAKLAQQAVEFGGDDALALSMAGFVLAFVVRDLETGVALIDRALGLNPNLAIAWFYGGWIKLYLGEPDAAIERFEQAMRLSPIDSTMPRMQNGIANAHFFAGRYDESSSWGAKVVRQAPDYQDALRITAVSNALGGRLEPAQKAVARLLQLNPSFRISNFRDVQGPYRRTEDYSRFEEGLRKAGLPE